MSRAACQRCRYCRGFAVVGGRGRSITSVVASSSGGRGTVGRLGSHQAEGGRRAGDAEQDESATAGAYRTADAAGCRRDRAFNKATAAVAGFDMPSGHAEALLCRGKGLLSLLEEDYEIQAETTIWGQRDNCDR
jgi:hypothetical protein